MFEEEDRQRVKARVVALAERDPRVRAGALIGSLAQGGGDRWSDLDLTFGIDDEVPREAVLADWTEALVETEQAIPLFDVESGAFLYRVHLLPGCLQVDLSVAPITRFEARSPKFQLLFGEARPHVPVAAPSPRARLGEGVHHALRARVAIERARPLQAAHWMAATRDIALELACLRHGLVGRQGRGYDDLPAAERARFGLGEAPGHGQREQLAAIVQELVAEARAMGGDDLVASLEELARS